MIDGIAHHLERAGTLGAARYQELRTFLTAPSLGFRETYADGCPCFLRGDLVLRVPVFADHLNFYVRGKAIPEPLSRAFATTPKGMVKLPYDHAFPYDAIRMYLDACGRD